MWIALSTNILKARKKKLVTRQSREKSKIFKDKMCQGGNNSGIWRIFKKNYEIECNTYANNLILNLLFKCSFQKVRGWQTRVDLWLGWRG